MKGTVVTDKSGRIIASAFPVKGHGGAPTYNKVVAEKDHKVHELDVPDDLAKPESAKRLHDEYKLEGAGEKAKLVKRK